MAELQKAKKDLEVCQTRLAKAQTPMLDGEISSSDYNGIKARLEPEISKLLRAQAGLSDGSRKVEEDMLDFGLYFLNNLPKLFTEADLAQKHRILSSTFPEKLVFEDGVCRTFEKESIFMLFTKPTKDTEAKKERVQDKSRTLSCCVVPPGFEPRLTEPKSVVLPLHNGTAPFGIANVKREDRNAKKSLRFFSKKIE